MGVGKHWTHAWHKTLRANSLRRNACLRAVDGADTSTVRETQHLNYLGIIAADDKVAIGIKREETPTAVELVVANGAHEGAITESEHWHARVAIIKNGQVTGAIASDRGNTVELRIASAPARGTNCSNMLAIAVPQHLHALTSFFGHKDVPRPVESDAQGGLELAVA
jgi:hypothetical protein